MELKIQKLSCPVIITVEEKSDVIKAKKQQIYDSIKKDLVFDGFRKGSVPIEVAEQKMGKQTLYKPIVDEMYFQAAKVYDVVAASNFKIYGDFLDAYDFKLEFLAEVKPTVKLPVLDTMKQDVPEMPVVNEDEIDMAVETARKEKETIEDAGKEILENLDLAVIDFEGTLVGENTPFKGGTAKGFKIDVNKLNDNGSKNFIDNFEDQMVGMRVGETRSVDVKFPDDYRDTSKNGKRAIFKVILLAIKKRVLPELNDSFIASKGFNSLGEYREFIKGNILSGKTRDRHNLMKKSMVGSIVEGSEISPLPEPMIEDELERQWNSLLGRLGQKEDEYLKRVPDGKTRFLHNTKESAIDMLRTSLVLELVAKEYKIDATKEEVLQYTVNVSGNLGYDKVKMDRMIGELDKPEQFEFMKKAALNEKTVEFIIGLLSK